jgi:hypothetical protein
LGREEQGSERIVGKSECAGINRHVVGDERAVIRQNFVHSQNQRFGDKVDAECSGKILAMIAPLRHLLGWIVSAFGSREASSSKIWLSASNC